MKALGLWINGDCIEACLAFQEALEVRRALIVLGHFLAPEELLLDRAVLVDLKYPLALTAFSSEALEPTCSRRPFHSTDEYQPQSSASGSDISISGRT